MGFITTFAIVVIALLVGFIVGVLVGRKNSQHVTQAVAAVQSSAADVTKVLGQAVTALANSTPATPAVTAAPAAPKATT